MKEQITQIITNPQLAIPLLGIKNVLKDYTINVVKTKDVNASAPTLKEKLRREDIVKVLRKNEINEHKQLHLNFLTIEKDALAYAYLASHWTLLKEKREQPQKKKRKKGLKSSTLIINSISSESTEEEVPEPQKKTQRQSRNKNKSSSKKKKQRKSKATKIQRTAQLKKNKNWFAKNTMKLPAKFSQPRFDQKKYNQPGLTDEQKQQVSIMSEGLQSQEGNWLAHKNHSFSISFLQHLSHHYFDVEARQKVEDERIPYRLMTDPRNAAYWLDVCTVLYRPFDSDGTESWNWSKNRDSFQNHLNLPPESSKGISLTLRGTHDQVNMWKLIGYHPELHMKVQASNLLYVEEHEKPAAKSVTWMKGEDYFKHVLKMFTIAFDFLDELLADLMNSDSETQHTEPTNALEDETPATDPNNTEPPTISTQTTTIDLTAAPAEGENRIILSPKPRFEEIARHQRPIKHSTRRPLIEQQEQQAVHNSLNIIQRTLNRTAATIAQTNDLQQQTNRFQSNNYRQQQSFLLPTIPSINHQSNTNRKYHPTTTQILRNPQVRDPRPIPPTVQHTSDQNLVTDYQPTRRNPDAPPPPPPLPQPPAIFPQNRTLDSNTTAKACTAIDEELKKSYSRDHSTSPSTINPQVVPVPLPHNSLLEKKKTQKFQEQFTRELLSSPKKSPKPPNTTPPSKNRTPSPHISPKKSTKQVNIASSSLELNTQNKTQDTSANFPSKAQKQNMKHVNILMRSSPQAPPEEEEESSESSHSPLLKKKIPIPKLPHLQNSTDDFTSQEKIKTTIPTIASNKPPHDNLIPLLQQQSQQHSQPQHPAQNIVSTIDQHQQTDNPIPPLQISLDKSSGAFNKSKPPSSSPQDIFAAAKNLNKTQPELSSHDVFAPAKKLNKVKQNSSSSSKSDLERYNAQYETTSLEVQQYGFELHRTASAARKHPVRPRYYDSIDIQNSPLPTFTNFSKPSPNRRLIIPQYNQAPALAPPPIHTPQVPTSHCGDIKIGVKPRFSGQILRSNNSLSRKALQRLKEQKIHRRLLETNDAPPMCPINTTVTAQEFDNVLRADPIQAILHHMPPPAYRLNSHNKIRGALATDKPVAYIEPSFVSNPDILKYKMDAMHRKTTKQDAEEKRKGFDKPELTFKKIKKRIHAYDPLVSPNGKLQDCLILLAALEPSLPNPTEIYRIQALMEENFSSYFLDSNINHLFRKVEDYFNQIDRKMRVPADPAPYVLIKPNQGHVTIEQGEIHLSSELLLLGEQAEAFCKNETQALQGVRLLFLSIEESPCSNPEAVFESLKRLLGLLRRNLLPMEYQIKKIRQVIHLLAEELQVPNLHDGTAEAIALQGYVDFGPAGHVQALVLDVLLITNQIAYAAWKRLYKILIASQRDKYGTFDPIKTQVMIGITGNLVVVTEVMIRTRGDFHYCPAPLEPLSLHLLNENNIGLIHYLLRSFDNAASDMDQRDNVSGISRTLKRTETKRLRTIQQNYYSGNADECSFDTRLQNYRLYVHDFSLLDSLSSASQEAGER